MEAMGGGLGCRRDSRFFERTRHGQIFRYDDKIDLELVSKSLLPETW